MPVFVLFFLAATIGVSVGLGVWGYPRRHGYATSRPTVGAAEKVGEAVGRHPRVHALLEARLDPTAATGLALTLALAFVLGGGVLLGVLALLIRTNSFLTGIDRGVAKWGNRHGSAGSIRALDDVTQLGSIYTVLVLCALLGVVETIRERSVWVIPFIATVIGGEEVLSLAVKQLTGRVRPAFNPAAATLGPSFPSGHSATAAAFYATAALLIGRWQRRRVRAVLAGLAAGIAVAVAASRVLLDVHWLSDVIGGLTLGWAWFAACGFAFGGRILRFGAGVETVERVADRATAT